MQNNRRSQIVRKHEVTNKEAKCILTIQAPRQRCDKFKHILNPVVRQFDPSSKYIHVSGDETLFRSLLPDRGGQHGGSIPRYQDNKTVLSTPALAVMIFLQERGTYAQEVRKNFQRYPWRVHHKIELQNKRSPTVKAGQQEFYSLSREYPLWSVCPVYAGFEHLRLCLFVRKFSQMVEFYRLVTDSEMESTKPDFCLFPLCSEDEVQVMLCLKRCKQLRPFPLSSAYLSFKVRNIVTLKSLLRGELQEITHNRYLIKDPDGNIVILQDMNITSPNSVSYENDVTSHIADVSCDVTSVKSVCGSHDSGRYSDSDQCASDLEHKGFKKAVHFSDTGFNHEKTVTYLNDQSRKYSNQTEPRQIKSRQPESDLSFEDYYDESSQKCYPGMVIAHARFIERQSTQTTAPDDNVPIMTIGSHQRTSDVSEVKLPIVTVTDCSGNIHNCIERVIYPSQCCIEQKVGKHYSAGCFERHELVNDERTDDYIRTLPESEDDISGPSRRQNEQNHGLDLSQVITKCRSDDRSGPWMVSEGGGGTDGLTVPSLPWGWRDSETQNGLCEDVIKKRLVKPVYI